MQEDVGPNLKAIVEKTELELFPDPGDTTEDELLPKTPLLLCGSVCLPTSIYTAEEVGKGE